MNKQKKLQNSQQIIINQSSIIYIPQQTENMGCQPSRSEGRGPQIKINIVDSGFMKSQNDAIRAEMQKQNISFQCFISLQCFFEEFSKRYYNRVVTSFDNYLELKNRLQKIGLTPNIYIVLNGNRFQQPPSFNTKIVENYFQLIKNLKDNAHNSIVPNSYSAVKQTRNKINVKILCKPGSRNSEQTIFETALKKFNITYEFFNSFQLLQQSIAQSQADFIVTDYIFHKQVIEIFNNTKSKVICFCSFDSSQTYSPEIYSLSNNYLDIANDLKNTLKMGNRGAVKCTKVYLYTNSLQEHEEIKNVLQLFDIEVRSFSNLEKVIKQTTYFFCVTVICAECETRNIQKFFERNDYLERIKIINIGNGTQASVKGLFKVVRNIKRGYFAQKGITNSIDIIDKHYNNTKFEQIKRELQNNDIRCFGFANLSEYIKNKKFISPFIICNFEQRTLLVKYMKQLQCKSKIIIFCNKNKITPQLKDNSNFSYVSSHFGKIIKFVRKTLVFLPVLDRQEQILFKEKIDKIKNKNKRISAIKWSQIDDALADEEKFQFLNISKDTNTASIKDIQKSVATIWRVQSSIMELQNFKNQFIKSLNELRKIHKINFSEAQYTQLVQKIKSNPMSQLLQRVKSFFDADNELGLEINKSLMKTESLEKKQIMNMRQFLLLVFINYLSIYQIPRIGRKKLVHYISNPLIEKCQIGSYIFSKHFVVFYQGSNSNSTLKDVGKYRIELQFQYNSLTQEQLFINSCFTYKDKLIFSPFSKFQIVNIQNASQFKVVTVKYLKNVDFLKFIFQENLLKPSQSINEFVEYLKNNQSPLIDSAIKQKFLSNAARLGAIEHFQRGQIEEAIITHKKLIKQNEQKQNLDSFLINELNFQLSCFYFKGNMNRQAGDIIKDLLQADPGQFIKGQCEKMIKQVIEVSEKQPEGRKRKVSEQALKTFVWLKNKQDISDQQIKSGSDESVGDDVIFDNELKCIQIDDIDQKEDFGNFDLGKQNIETA